MRIILEVNNLPDLDDQLQAAELAQSLRHAVIERLEAEGYPFGSGHSVWAFDGD